MSRTEPLPRSRPAAMAGSNPCAPRCLTGSSYDRIGEAQAISRPGPSYDEQIAASYSTGGAYQADSAPSDVPAASGGAEEVRHGQSIFSVCCPNKLGTTIDCFLVAALAVTEVGASLGIASVLLLCDSLRRLSCVLLLIWEMEAPELVAATAKAARALKTRGTDPRTLGHRARLLARGMIGVYLMTASFFMSTVALARMYGHDPPPLVQPGWLIFIGSIGLASDVLHAFSGVRQSIYHEESNLSRLPWLLAHFYGSLLVMLEGLLGVIDVGNYLDPLMALGLAGLVAGFNLIPMQQVSAELFSAAVGADGGHSLLPAAPTEADLQSQMARLEAQGLDEFTQDL